MILSDIYRIQSSCDKICSIVFFLGDLKFVESLLSFDDFLGVTFLFLLFFGWFFLVLFIFGDVLGSFLGVFLEFVFGFLFGLVCFLVFSPLSGFLGRLAWFYRFPFNLVLDDLGFKLLGIEGHSLSRSNGLFDILEVLLEVFDLLFIDGCSLVVLEVVFFSFVIEDYVAGVYFHLVGLLADLLDVLEEALREEFPFVLEEFHILEVPEWFRLELGVEVIERCDPPYFLDDLGVLPPAPPHNQSTVRG